MKREVILTAGLALLALSGCHHKTKAKPADAVATEASASSAADDASAAATGASADEATPKKN